MVVLDLIRVMVIKIYKNFLLHLKNPDAAAMNNLIPSLRSGLLLIILLFPVMVLAQSTRIRILVVTGGHEYDTAAFGAMFDSMEDMLSYKTVSFPEAFRSFEPEYRHEYDAVVLYHMWQEITPDQEKNLSACIRDGMPLVVLHHSICAFDDWEEYRKITGGRYFHRPDTIDGRIYPVSGYKHDVRVKIHVADSTNPVTKSLTDVELWDETYEGFYVEPLITPLLTTDTPGSSPVIGWAKTYGRARVVTLQPGHDARTYNNNEYRKLLRQAIGWVYNSGKQPTRD
jgi:uncharacterized protein